MVKKSYAKVLDSVEEMAERLLDIDMEFQDEPEHTVTFQRAFQGEGCSPRGMVLTMIFGIGLMLSFFIWYGIEHSS